MAQLIIDSSDLIEMTENQKIWSDSIDRILSVGVSLQPYGVSNFALSRSSALDVLSQFAELRIGVLGGDVYVKNKNYFESTCDNWCIEPMMDDSNDDYVYQSIRKSREFIERYQLDDAYFALVPKLE